MLTSMTMLAQNGGVSAGEAVFAIVYLAVLILSIVSLWVIFTKAGKPGWASIVPIYNIIVLMEIVGKPSWWVILMFIPLVNIIICVLVFMGLAKSFGKSELFGIGLFLLSPIFMPMLAFGDATYEGPSA